MNTCQSEAYQKQRQRVQWQTHGVETQAIQPDLDVLESLDNFAPSELLVIRRITVSPESCLDESTLVVCQPIDCLGIIRDEPVGCYGDDNGQKTFL